MSRGPRKPRDSDDPRLDDARARLGLDNYEKGKSFEQKVAELFSLLGYQTLLDYKMDDMQFDIRLELSMGIPIHALVECKNTERATQEHVRDFASKVDSAVIADGLTYQAILVAGNGFANNAHVMAKKRRVQLRTYEELLRSLVDFRPNLDAAIRSFQGTPLERLYVEQEVVLDGEIRPGKDVPRKSLTEAVLDWLEQPSGNFLALLGDFGCGKTSFSKRLASELASQAREEMAQGTGTTRVPVLIDLREGGSSTVTLESLLTQHFQRLSSQPFNPQALLQLNREGYLVLLFDGFDETITYTEPGRYVENLRQILRAAEGKAKVLLTCRTHYFRDRPEVLDRLGKAPAEATTPGATQLLQEIQERPGTEIGYIYEFSREQISEYLTKALPPPADWQSFRQRIQDTYNLENLAERPFLLEIIVKTLPRLEHQGDVTLADLYESYCAAWFNHTDFRLTLTRDHKKALVEHLARLVWGSKEGRVHYTVLYKEATAYFKDRSLSFQDKERIDYEVRTALFLNRDAEGRYTFIHRSFLEFFIARTLRTGLAAGDTSCLALRRITREVVFFLEFWPEAKRIPDFAGRVLAGTYQPGVSENALLLLYFHARARLGPLAGPQADSDPDLDRIREAFSRMRPQAIQLPGAMLEGAALPGIDLGMADLSGAWLDRADLRRASLAKAQLAQAHLRFVNFRQGIADRTDLTEAKLDHLNAQDASFRKADLRGADLSFARFTRSDLLETSLHQVETVGTGFLGAKRVSPFVRNTTAGGPEAPSLEIARMRSRGSSVSSVAWSPDARCVAAGADDGSIGIWDVETGNLLRLLSGHDANVNSISWSPDGMRLASGSSDNTVKLWEASSGQLVNTLRGHHNWVRSVSWSPDGKRLASGSSDNTVRLWEASSGRLVNTLRGHRNWVRSVSWSPDGTRLASGSSDSTVKLWESPSGRLLNTFIGHDNWVFSVSWSPDGTRLASGSRDRMVKLWAASTGRLLSTFSDRDNNVLAVSWSPDGTRLASGSSGKTVKLWDAASGKLINTLVGHDSWVTSVSWSPDGTRLISGSDDKTVKLWEASSGRLVNTFTGYDNLALAVSWSPDGTRLASGSADKTVKLWDASSGRLLNTLAGHNHRVRSVSWSPDGTHLASGSYDKAVKLWDVSSGRVLNTLDGHDDRVLTVSWSPDGTRLASGSDDKTVKLWEALSGRLLNTLTGHDHWARSVSWSPDGTRLASGSSDNTVKLWESASGRLLNTLTGHEKPVNSVSWSPDGTCLASGSSDNTVKLWESSSGRLLNTLTGHEKPVFSTSWSPDGARLASGSFDKTVKLWDASSGRLLSTLSGRDNNVFSVSWSPDGTRLAASTSSGIVAIWDLTSPEPRLLVRFYGLPGGSGFAATPDGYVSGPSEALATVRFQDNWAFYDITDVPERVSPERVAAALRRSED